MSTVKFPFYETIDQLRQSERLLLYNHLPEIAPKEEKLVMTYLETEYKKEALNYPNTPPDYNPDAALWAAKTVYRAGQLLLYRETDAEQIPVLLHDFKGSLSPSTILSADLCLRFLPSLLFEATHIDPNDKLNQHTQQLLQRWHYSGIGSTLNTEELDFSPIHADKCLEQLYVDRVIREGALVLAKHKTIEPLVRGALGDYRDELWRNFV